MNELTIDLDVLNLEEFISSLTELILDYINSDIANNEDKQNNIA